MLETNGRLADLPRNPFEPRGVFPGLVETSNDRLSLLAHTS